jgi:hypothetical protein
MDNRQWRKLHMENFTTAHFSTYNRNDKKYDDYGKGRVTWEDLGTGWRKSLKSRN